MRVCGLVWNSGGAGIRSVAVGLHDVLGVGELVELVDVGLGNHDVDGGENSGLLVGSCIQSCVPAWRGRGSPGGSRASSMPTRVASARPCVSNKKSAGRAWQLCQALDGYSLSLPKRSINRSASKIARIKNQAIAKQSCRPHTVVACVRRPSQFVYPSTSPICGSKDFRNVDSSSCEPVKRWREDEVPVLGVDATVVEPGE